MDHVGVKSKLVFLVLFLLLAIVSAISLSFGSSDVAFKDIFTYIFDSKNLDPTAVLILEKIRIPRLLVGFLSGSALACAGLAMQSLFRNPLADPSITGVSAGAAVGAVCYMTFFGGFIFGMQIFAFTFGLLAYFCVWFLGRLDGKISTLSLLLAGIAINAFCGAIVAFSMYAMRESGMRGFIFWSLGSLEFSSLTEILFSLIFAVPAFFFLIRNAKAMNLLSLGTSQAFYSGVNVERLQFSIAICAATLTSISVALCGTIAFVGLIVPHIMRSIAGSDNRLLLPLSALGGALIITSADILSRSHSFTDPVPIGVITAFIGAPFFAYILRFRKND